jgi:hypothetical protein
VPHVGLVHGVIGVLLRLVFVLPLVLLAVVDVVRVQRDVGLQVRVVLGVGDVDIEDALLFLESRLFRLVFGGCEGLLGLLEPSFGLLPLCGRAISGCARWEGYMTVVDVPKNLTMWYLLIIVDLLAESFFSPFLSWRDCSSFSRSARTVAGMSAFARRRLMSLMRFRFALLLPPSGACRGR